MYVTLFFDSRSLPDLKKNKKTPVCNVLKTLKFREICAVCTICLDIVTRHFSGKDFSSCLAEKHIRIKNVSQ